MYKFVILSALFAAALAAPKPSQFEAVAPLAYAAPAAVAIPAAVSQQYRTDVYSKPVVAAYAAPAVTAPVAYAAPAVAAPVAAPTVYAAPAVAAPVAPVFAPAAAPVAYAASYGYNAPAW